MANELLRLPSEEKESLLKHKLRMNVLELRTLPKAFPRSEDYQSSAAFCSRTASSAGSQSAAAAPQQQGMAKAPPQTTTIITEAEASAVYARCAASNVVLTVTKETVKGTGAPKT